MPAFCAALGSFHPKSSVMYLVRVLTTVRVLPFLFLTLTLIRSSILTVSTFGVRSYKDQRYWSTQTSRSGHASRASALSAGPTAVCKGSVGLTAANGTGGVTDCGARGGSDEAALLLAILATDIPCSPSTVARDASTCSARAVANAARLTSIGAPLLSTPSEPRPGSPPATQPARASIADNAANTPSRRTSSPPSLFEFLPCGLIFEPRLNA